MILHKKADKMLKRVFSLIKKICFMIQIHDFLQSMTGNNLIFLGFKRVTPTFSNLGKLLKIYVKSYPLLGKLLSVWSFFLAVSLLPKSAQSAQTVENSIAFSMFPILDTNLCISYNLTRHLFTDP